MAKRGRKRQKTRTKTRTRTRIITKVRRVGSKMRRRVSSKKKNTLWKGIKTFAIGGSAISLLANNQLNAVPTNDIGMKLKAVANAIGGSFLNINVFSDAPQAHFHPDLSGALNQWTTTFGAMWLGGAIAKRFGLKRAGKIEQLGKEGTPIAAVAGIFGFRNNNPVSGKSDPYAMVRQSSQTSTALTVSGGSSNLDSPMI